MYHLLYWQFDLVRWNRKLMLFLKEKNYCLKILASVSASVFSHWDDLKTLLQELQGYSITILGSQNAYYSMESHGIIWYCMVLDLLLGIELYPYGIA